MDFKPEIKALQEAIAYLEKCRDLSLETLSPRQIKKMAHKLAEHVDNIYYIDDLMPLEEFVEKFTDRADREAFLMVMDLLEEALTLVEEVLGPFDEEEEEDIPAPEEPAPEQEEDEEDGDPLSRLVFNRKPNRHLS